MSSEGWGNAHRALLQALMARGAVTLEEGTTVLREILLAGACDISSIG